MPTEPRPLVLISTGTNVVDLGLRRENVVTGRNYAQAVLAEGGLPLLVANLDPEIAAAYVARADALLLSGGADVDPARFGQPPHPDLGVVDPERDAFELALYAAARAAGKPVLGVCRGIQVINVAEGGSLHQHLPALGRGVQHSQADRGGRPHHRVALAADSRLRAGFGGAEAVFVNTYHHQGLDRLGNGLRAVAHADDGLVEAVEGSSGAWLLGVQWHPEMSYAAYTDQRAPFRAFLEACNAAVAA
jgi:putative glutamine amidotransferase